MGEIKQMNNTKQKSNIFLYIFIIIGLIIVVSWFGLKFFKEKEIKEFVQIEANDLSSVIQKMNALNFEKGADKKEINKLVKEKEDELLRISEALSVVSSAKDSNNKVNNKEIVELNNEIDEFYQDLETVIKEYQGVASYNLKGLKITEPFSKQLISLLTVLEMIQNSEDLNSAEVKEILVASQTTFNLVYTQFKEVDVPEKLNKKHESDIQQFERFDRRMNLMMESYNAGEYQKAGDYLFSIGELAKELASEDKKDWRKEYFEEMMVEFERLNDKAKEIKIKLEYLNDDVKGNMKEVEIEEWT